MPGINIHFWQSVRNMKVLNTDVKGSKKLRFRYIKRQMEVVEPTFDHIMVVVQMPAHRKTLTTVKDLLICQSNAELKAVDKFHWLCSALKWQN